MTDKSEFLPFHAINEFMRPDFRLIIIREVLASQPGLPQSLSADLDRLIKKYVNVPGFRHSDKAPALIKVLPASKAFEKYPDFVAVMLACWAKNQSALMDQVWRLLQIRNWRIVSQDDNFDLQSITQDLPKEWPIFPIEMDRTRLPGFYTHWPKGEDFEALYNNFSELYPEASSSLDKVSLMVVWLSMRLPYQIDTPEIQQEQ